MRILYVIPSLLTGGAEAVVSQWALYLQQAGHSVEICTLYTKGPFAGRLEARGIRIHNLDHDPGISQYRLKRKYDPRLVPMLRRVVRGGEYDLVHAHLFPAFLHVALLSFFHNQQPYLYSEHSVRNRRRRFRSLKRLDRVLYGRYRQVLPVSEEVRRALGEWLPELEGKMQVVPNGVDPQQLSVSEEAARALRQELGLQPGEQVVLFAGRLIPDKGPDLLLEGLSCLNGQVRNPVRVLIAGEGPMRAGLEERGRQLRPPVQVSFLGNRSDMPGLLHLADLLAIPSRWEGLPMVLLEALAARTPVLAAPVGGIPEAIQHGFSGWLAPAEDPVALAQGMAVMLGSEDLRRRLSENAFRTFEAKYSPRVAMSRLVEVYTSVMDGEKFTNGFGRG